jgi:hypothetical protein
VGFYKAALLVPSFKTFITATKHHNFQPLAYLSDLLICLLDYPPRNSLTCFRKTGNCNVDPLSNSNRDKFTEGHLGLTFCSKMFCPRFPLSLLSSFKFRNRFTYVHYENFLPHILIFISHSQPFPLALFLAQVTKANSKQDWLR